MAQKEHEAILQRVAKETFRPQGLVQKGRSRVWLYDHGWWLTVVELQPSSWNRGSYLNVGAMWLVYPLSHVAFHDGYRREPFSAFRDAEQFQRAASDLCVKALEYVATYRSSIHTVADAHARLETLVGEQGERGRPLSLWDLYFAAIFATLCGKGTRANALHERIRAHQPTTDWESELQHGALATLGSANPREAASAHVQHTRAALKLAPNVRELA